MTWKPKTYRHFLNPAQKEKRIWQGQNLLKRLKDANRSEVLWTGEKKFTIQPVLNQKNQPVLNQKNQPVLNQKNQPVLNQKNQPVLNQKNQPVLNQKNQPVLNQKNQPVVLCKGPQLSLPALARLVERQQRSASVMVWAGAQHPGRNLWFLLLQD